MARHNAGTKKWDRKAGWCNTGVSWERFEAELDK